MPPHPWNDFEIYKFCQNKHAANQGQQRFNGVYSRNSLPKTEDRAYVTNLDKCESIGTHSIALHMNGNNITYFDSFGAEHVPKEIKKLINNQNITNIYRIQAHDSNVHIFLYWSYWFFMLQGKKLADFRTSFSPNNFQ